MTSTLTHPPLRDVLDRLFAAAAHDDEQVTDLADPGAFLAAPHHERAESRAEVYMPISAAGGELLYALVRSARPATVVEFGTSFGISTIYLAAAVSDNGTGHVYGSELSATKLAAARDNLAAAGVADQVTLLPGDARRTLREVPGPIGLVLLDGWKDACLDALRALEPRLAPGALVVADDTTFDSMAGYLRYVRNPANGYVSVAFPVEDGMEISCWSRTRR
ncbi:O-methyltransferase [Cryptosporangium japonicum]|uniref:Class I SAM-dependent methyltransferase n=1 Tax=Cryptosporangium japonicum TaxID=80872 RepID=A0ABP3DTS0_9ACTN